MSESLTLYKLIILYMLNKVTFPLNNAQISDFILNKEYTTYFTLQQAISELVDSSLIKEETFKGTTQYHLTDEGINTLEFFGNKISPAIIEDINAYLSDNKMDLINEVAAVADYYKSTNNDYIVECHIREKNSDLVAISISVPSREQAESICSNWKLENQNIYAILMDKLLK